MVRDVSPQPLNRIPVGLLDLFGIKSMGQYPQSLLNQLQPVIDLLPWYTQAQATNVQLSRAPLVGNAISGGRYTWTASTIAVLPATTGEIRVPDNEIWYVSQYSVQWSFDTAGQVASLRPGYYFTGLGYTTVWQLPSTDNALIAFTGVGTGGTGMSATTIPFFLPPGSSPALAVGVQQLPGGQVDVSGSMRLMRFLI